MAYSKAKFEDLYKEFLNVEAELLNIKRGEYTADGTDDCLENFRKVAAFEGTTPEKVCLTYALKHIHSIVRAVNTDRYDLMWWNEKDQVEGLKQRIADARNYLVLLAGILEDKEMELHRKA